MKRSTGIIKDIWHSHQGYLGERSGSPEKLQFEEMVGRFFCPGPFYYYVIDSPTLTFDYVSNSVRSIFGVEPGDFTLPGMLESVHPDDINFMARCEDIVADLSATK